jgi:hypothetical protein
MSINHHVALTTGLYMIIYIVELILLEFPKPVSYTRAFTKINRRTVFCMCVRFGYYNYFVLFVVIVCSLDQVFVPGLSRILITVLIFIPFTSLPKYRRKISMST